MYSMWSVNLAELTFEYQHFSSSFIGIWNAHVVYLTGAHRVRSTGFVYGGPFLEALVGVRKVDVVYLAGAHRIRSTGFIHEGQDVRIYIYSLAIMLFFSPVMLLSNSHEFH